MTVNTCPEPRILQLFMLGALNEPQAKSLEHHLLSCSTCSETAASFGTGDGIEPTHRTQQFLSNLRQDKVTIQAIERSSTFGDFDTIQSDQTEIKTSRFSSIDSAYDFLDLPESPDEIGRLGGYRILRVLGEGGMGVVFLAEDPRLKRKVALKAMRTSIGLSRSAKERFIREAQFNASIEHDHIVHIYQVGEHRGIPFIAMQYLQGESLKSRMDQERPLSQLEVVRIGKEVVDGLAAAHERGLIHRDIKPDNIWLDEKSNRAKILDFGLVRAAEDNHTLTASGALVGTPRYMAPEQAMGNEVDHRCDLFALGSVLYQMVSRKHAFQGSNLTSILMSVTQTEPAPIETLEPDIHPALAQLISRLLRKNRDERPQSSSEVHQTLVQIEQELRSCPIESIATVDPKSQRTPPKEPPNYTKILAAAAGAGGFIILLGVIITITRPDGTKTTIKVPSGVTTEIEAQPGSKVSIQELAEEDKPTPAKSIVANAKVDFEAERKVAEFLLTKLREGFIEVQLEEGGETQKIRSGSQSLPTKNFFITELQLLFSPVDPENLVLQDSDLAQLGSLGRLSKLLVAYAPVTTKGIEHLPALSSLEQLEIQHSKIDSGIGTTLLRWPNLKTLYVQGNKKLGDEGIPQFPPMAQLENLSIGGTSVSDKGLRLLASKCPNLKRLVIEGVGQPTCSLLGAAAFTNLTEITFSESQISPDGIKALSALPKLGSISVYGKVTDASVPQLKPLFPKIEFFEIFNYVIEEPGLTLETFKGIASMPNLESLSLQGHYSPDDSDLMVLSRIPKLKQLQLQFVPKPVDPVNFPNARRLYTQKGIDAFRNARPDVVLYADGTLYDRK